MLRPVCPHCQSELVPFSFDGYYDSFVGWACRCSSLPGAVEVSGVYSSSDAPRFEEVFPQAQQEVQFSDSQS